MNAQREELSGVVVCPACGSDEIRCVRRRLTRTYQGQRYTVPNLKFHECPRCGERVFGPEAVRQIQARSPAFAGHHGVGQSV